ncbi:unnamed protein product (macronuclear) [Paramecium tetraurelia]|uniref:Ankyrin repeat protein n=1 Tax=Paramecium tetraurelia TaxID=5888 RepID=A0CBU7_PARTE|nr:uncharacterized protein GSPATT00037047001 [Paramecium tetraurelia]CAK68264.1 unnamed protein product [Paramecium tetraurelia]|eukprot:XP_001435661.1 hypothetical protein (macronuclear) [Paramecium tetraurelia strain d4-2]
MQATVQIKHLQQVRKEIMNSKSYSEEQQHKDDFMRKMRHTLANGIISSYKELVIQNQIYNYDFNGYLIQKYKRGPLHLVCENGRITLIRYFIENNLFDINEICDGHTPLSLLSLYYIQTPEKCTSTETLELMFAKGADPLLYVDKNGNTLNDYCNMIKKQSEEPLNLVLQYIQNFYLKKQREQALKNAILLSMCDNQNNNNNLTNLLNIDDMKQIAQYLVGPIQYQIDQ